MLDSIKHIQKLLSAGMGVFFQSDDINTLDEDSELRLTIMSGIVQDELRKLSSRVKFGHQKAIKIMWCWATAASLAMSKTADVWS